MRRTSARFFHLYTPSDLHATKAAMIVRDFSMPRRVDLDVEIAARLAARHRNAPTEGLNCTASAAFGARTFAAVSLWCAV
jgi:hypothetical protein